MHRHGFCFLILCWCAVSVAPSSAHAQQVGQRISRQAVETAACAERVSADDPDDSIVDEAIARLAADGFRDLAAIQEGRCLIIQLENIRYREEKRAVREAAEIVLPLLGAEQELILIPTTRLIPIAMIRFASCDPERDGGVSTGLATFDMTHLAPRLRNVPRTHSSVGQLTLLIHPWIEARFGTYEEIAKTRVGVAPEVRIPIASGLVFSAQALVTLQDELYPDEARIRPVKVTLNQIGRFSRNVVVSGTVGAFRGDRYGAAAEARAFGSHGRYSAGVELGLTGPSAYGRRWRFGTPESPLALTDLAARVGSLGLVVRATAGVFMDGDAGVRLDAVREFGEFEIGWYALKTEAGSNGGFTIRIPLVPSTRAELGGVVVSSANAFEWEYRYRALERVGRRYDTGARLREFPNRLDSTSGRSGDESFNARCAPVQNASSFPHP